MKRPGTNTLLLTGGVLMAAFLVWFAISSLLLAEYLVWRATRQIGKAITVIEPAAYAAFGACDWQGNIRELQNVIERAVILRSGAITLEDLPEPIRRPAQTRMVMLEGSLEEMERKAIMEELAQCDGNRRLAAERLAFQNVFEAGSSQRDRYPSSIARTRLAIVA